MKDFAMRFKVFLYVSDPSTDRVKINYKQCFGRSLVSTRLGATIMMPTTFTLSKQSHNQLNKMTIVNILHCLPGRKCLSACISQI